MDQIEPRILLLREQRVLLDADLADLYGVTTRRLNEQVRRNVDRFPGDFMFRLTAKERAEVVLNFPHLSRLKFANSLPQAFTEHGAIMAASVLNSPRAVDVSVFVVRAFVKLRQLITTHKDLAVKLAELERKLGDHDQSILSLMTAIRQLMAPPPAPSKPKIGFRG
ncbi:MAG: ORF6N domain-containing protein [Pirellulaceae bacterium]|nr:ORF6N domain-containing protein [Pirellulaceae bacterium]